MKIKDASDYWKDVKLDYLGKLSDFSVPIYKGVNSWEEKSSPKGRNKKRARSQSKSPSAISKKINLRPEYLNTEEGEVLGDKTTTGPAINDIIST